MTASLTPQALLQKAARLRSEGRVAEAIAAYEHLLARRPDLPESWYNLAFLQRQAGRYEEALASYQAALDRGVSAPEEVHLNCGVIYSQHLRREDAAENELRAALALNPDYVPALLNLGNLHEDRGEKGEARALYERCLSLDPGCYEALARLANLGMVSRADDPLVVRLKQAIAGPRTPAADRASLGFALGKTLDGGGAYDEAFEAYAAANRASRESAGARGPLYDRRGHERFIGQLIKSFAPGHIRAAASGNRPPIFICGMFRSGSTLAEQVLASHARVTAGGEIDALPALVRTKLAPFPASMTNMDAAALGRHAADYLGAVAALFPEADVLTDKRPDNFLYIGLIKSLFPDAKIVHTVRDALDNCLSVYFLHLAHAMGYALDLLDTGHYYRQYRMLMAHWKALYGGDIFDFDYDAFVRGPKPVTERLLDFCGLEWDEACLDFHRTRNAVKTASVWQVREPLYTRSSGRARHYEKQIAPLRAYLQDIYPGRE